MQITNMVSGRLPHLRPALRRVAEFVVENPAAVAAMSIDVFAETCDVSTATVVRFCREINVAGYRQLRLILAAETGGREHFGVGLSGEITESDNVADMTAKIAKFEAYAIQETALGLSATVLDAVVMAVASARRVDLFGIESSAVAAISLQQRLLTIGIVAFGWSDPHLALMATALAQPGDVAIGFSHSGWSGGAVAPLALAHRNKATTVAITSTPQSPITAEADHVLMTVAPEKSFRSAEAASRISQFLVTDCIFAGVARANHERSEQALRTTRTAVESYRFSGELWSQTQQNSSRERGNIHK